MLIIILTPVYVPEHPQSNLRLDTDRRGTLSSFSYVVPVFFFFFFRLEVNASMGT